MIRDLTAADLPSAGALLVQRHRDHGRDRLLLDTIDVTRAVAEVEALVNIDGARGCVAIQGNQVVGYLIGASRPSASWGANVWVEAAGCAGENLPELWAYLATDWVAAGFTAHYVVVPPSIAPTFLALGFGIQHVHALQPAVALPHDPRVRRAVRSDLPDLARLDVMFSEHLAAAPIFSAAPPVTYDAALRDGDEEFEDSDYHVLVAEIEGEALGSAIGCDIGKSTMNAGLIAARASGFLGFACVHPKSRGSGLGRALGQAVSTWAAEAGDAVVCTDWRSTNLSADRAWPALGYQTSFLRLHRNVGY